MKIRHLLILLTVLALLAAALVFKSRETPDTLTTELYTPLDLQFEPAKVTQIRLWQNESEDNGVLLTRKESAWILESLWKTPAESSKIRDLFQTLMQAKGDLRSSDPALVPEYGLKENEAIHFEFLDESGEAALHLLLSKKRPTRRSVFLRKSGSGDVFYSETSVLEKIGLQGERLELDPPSDFWVDLTLASIDSFIVTGFRIVTREKGEEKISADLKRVDGSTWEFADPRLIYRPHTNKTESFLESFNFWKAVKVADPGADYGFDRSKWEMTIENKDGGTTVLKLADNPDGSNSSFLSNSARGTVYEVLEPTVRKLYVNQAGFVPRNPFGLEQERVTSFSVKGQNGAFSLEGESLLHDESKLYLTLLETISIHRFLSVEESRKVKRLGEYSVTVSQSDFEEPFVLEAGPALDKDETEYPARVSGTDLVFTIEKPLFERIFVQTEGLGKALSGQSR